MINLPATRPRRFLRNGLPVAVLLICVPLLWQRVSIMDMGAIRAAVGAVGWNQWLLAVLATCLSFQAIGRYDAVWHRLMGTGVSPAIARRAGMRAIAVAQLLGFGAVTGSLVRWRCLPMLSLWQATRLSIAVTLAFTLCWALFASCAFWWSGLYPAFSALHLGLLLLAAGILITMVRRRLAHNLTTADMGQLMVWTAVDLCCAAVALFVLLLDAIDVSFSHILAAYVLALGAGLVSNTPGGAGAFDLTLLTLLPMATPEPLVAAIIAFRLVYYLLPASLALVSLARPVRQAGASRNTPAHWALARQSGEVRTIADQVWYLSDLPFVMTAVGPAHRATAKAPNLTALRGHAAIRTRFPALYNCDPRLAMAARNAGWHVRRTAMEALIRPATWSTAGNRRQTLRRKLRHAAAAGVEVTRPGAMQPIEQMRHVARQWALSHGGELGLSMGRFCPDLLNQQEVFLITIDGQITGFVSFHASPTGWVLDLIRHVDGIPDGAIQAAIVGAIETARQSDIPMLSLACTPDPRYTPDRWANRKAGLIQFKRSFGPIWVPRYHAAPSRFSFWVTGVVIGIGIHRPWANLPWKLARRIKIIMQKYQVAQVRY